MSTHKVTCGVFSFLFNALLITLVSLNPPKRLRLYKLLIFMTSLSSIMYSILDMAAQPTFHTHDAGFVIFRKPKNSMYNKHHIFLLICAYFGWYGVSVAILAVHFIYRYGVLNRDFYSKYLFGWRVYAMFLIPLFYGVVWFVLCMTIFQYNHEVDEYMKASVFNEYGFTLEDISYVGAVFHFPTNGTSDSTVANKSAFIATSCLCLMVITSLFSVFYCAYKSYRNFLTLINKVSIVSPLTKSIQRQLYFALITQSLIPIVLMYPFPVLFSLSPMFNLDLGFSTSICTDLISIYPAVDPLPNLIIILWFGKAVKGISIRFFIWVNGHGMRETMTMSRRSGGRD